MIKVVPRGQLSPPSIIHKYRCADFGNLHNGLNLTTIPHALPGTLCKKKIDRTFLIAIAPLKEGIPVKEGLQPIFGGSAFQEFCSNGLGDEHMRKEKGELRQEIEVVESNDAGTVDGAAGRCMRTTVDRRA